MGRYQHSLLRLHLCCGSINAFSFFFNDNILEPLCREQPLQPCKPFSKRRCGLSVLLLQESYQWIWPGQNLHFFLMWTILKSLLNLLKCCFCFILCLLFVFPPHGVWDLSSPTRTKPAPHVSEIKVPTCEHQGSAHNFFFFHRFISVFSLWPCTQPVSACGGLVCSRAAVPWLQSAGSRVLARYSQERLSCPLADGVFVVQQSSPCPLL